MTTNRNILSGLKPLTFKIDKTNKEYGFTFIKFSSFLIDPLLGKIEDWINENEAKGEINDDIIKIQSKFSKPLRDELPSMIREVSPNIGDIISSLTILEDEAEQNSDEWEEKRKEYFTSTSTHVGMDGKELVNIYRVIKYKTIAKLGVNAPLSKAITERDNVKSPMAWGNNFEKIARREVEVLTGEDIEEHGLLYTEDLPFATSVDGMTFFNRDVTIQEIEFRKGDKVVWEFKCPSYENFLDPNYKNKSVYILQQHQHHLITGARIIFVKYFPYCTPKLEEVDIRESIILDMLSTMISTSDKIDSIVNATVKEQEDVFEF